MFWCPGRMMGVAALKPAEMVACLHACAGVGSECKRCLKECGYGCSRDLKMEAAAMIQAMAAELETIKHKSREGNT